VLRRLPTLAGAVALVAAASFAAAGAASAGRPLVTSIYPVLRGADAAAQKAVFARVEGAGATMVRLNLDWAQVAPAQRPSSFDPANPADPAYRWGDLDEQVTLAVKAGLTPYLTISHAPRWAQNGWTPEVGDSSARPDPRQFALFATAVARRYGGGFQGLPRVRYFQAWNEQNLATNLWPQLENGKAVAPDLYRQLLNAFYAAIHAVHANNVVIAGGLAPFKDSTEATYAQDHDWGPLSFMADLLCETRGYFKTCSDKVSFDVWATHPYTSGGPQHTALLPNDVSLGDLPEMKQLLEAAKRHHTIRSRNGVGFWVTEFSWDSSPPDPEAVPIAKLNQWVPEALYRMWRLGITNVTWFSLADERPPSFYQSGLYFAGATAAGGKAKPYLRAFRFPVVALRKPDGRYLVWGRTPSGKKASVVVEHVVGSRRTKVATLKTDGHGIFQGTYALGSRGTVVAHVARTKQRSLPYALKPVPDHFYNPFGRPLEPDTANP
jgi:hypothetical protein